MRKIFISILITSLALWFCSCGTTSYIIKDTGNETSDSFGLAQYPDLSLAIVSDVHLCEVSDANRGKNLGTKKFAKLLEDSDEINVAAFGIIGDSDARIVVVPGDLTEYGEFSNHAKLASYFARIEKSGKKVYVIPGNHDIMNFNSRLSPSGPKERSITASEFAEIYSDFGYGEALARDPESLSYLAEPVPGLWLIGLDSLRYDEQNDSNPCVTAGRIRAETLTWMEGILAKSVREKKAVIAFMHHNLLEHFATEKKYFGAYVVENNERVASMLAHYNVRLVFTGHFHAEDITLARPENGKFLYDVETGSLVSFPCPLRFIRIDAAGQKASFSSARVTSTPSHPSGFQAYVKEQLRQALMENSDSVLRKYGVPSPGSELLSAEAADGYLSHEEGDENPANSTWDPSGAGCFYGCILNLFASDLATSIWKDLPPPDDTITIDLASGDWVKN